jgi:hypothetical protein
MTGMEKNYSRMVSLLKHLKKWHPKKIHRFQKEAIDLVATLMKYLSSSLEQIILSQSLLMVITTIMKLLFIDKGEIINALD